MVTCLQTTQHKTNQHPPNNSCKTADFRQILQFTCPAVVWMNVCSCSQLRDLPGVQSMYQHASAAFSAHMKYCNVKVQKVM